MKEVYTTICLLTRYMNQTKQREKVYKMITFNEFTAKFPKQNDRHENFLQSFKNYTMRSIT